jgi:hypothetical protein
VAKRKRKGEDQEHEPDSVIKMFFCAMCGSPIWEEPSLPVAASEQTSQLVVCPLCGHEQTPPTS